MLVNWLTNQVMMGPFLTSPQSLTLSTHHNFCFIHSFPILSNAIGRLPIVPLYFHTQFLLISSQNGAFFYYYFLIWPNNQTYNSYLLCFFKYNAKFQGLYIWHSPFFFLCLLISKNYHLVMDKTNANLYNGFWYDCLLRAYKFWYGSRKKLT